MAKGQAPRPSTADAEAWQVSQADTKAVAVLPSELVCDLLESQGIDPSSMGMPMTP